MAFQRAPTGHVFGDLIKRINTRLRRRDHTFMQFESDTFSYVVIGSSAEDGWCAALDMPLRRLCRGLHVLKRTECLPAEAPKPGALPSVSLHRDEVARRITNALRAVKPAGMYIAWQRGVRHVVQVDGPGWRLRFPIDLRSFARAIGVMNEGDYIVYAVGGDGDGKVSVLTSEGLVERDVVAGSPKPPERAAP